MLEAVVRVKMSLVLCGNRSKCLKLATISNLAYPASYIRSTFYVRVLCQWADFMIRTSAHMSSWKSNGTICVCSGINIMTVLWFRFEI